MKAIQAASVLALAGRALAHGYIWRVTADNVVYPGFDIYIDPSTKPAVSRIAYGGGSTNPVGPKVTGNDMACSTLHTPVPNAIAEVRAGSNITFHWSPWLYSHKGPVTAWMAPYTGEIAKVNVNELEFFKFAEDAIGTDGSWATVRMLDKTNNTFTATVPADIKPGNYIIRQEIIALHFALNVSKGFEGSPIGPQFYMTCFNFKVTGSGTVTPKGAKFPGAYSTTEAGFKYDVKGNGTFPFIGPALYKSTANVDLAPKARVVISPTGGTQAQDDAYFSLQDGILVKQGQNSQYFDSIGG